MIDFLNEISQLCFDSMWRATWQGSLIIVVLWAGSRLWKGMPASVRSALWWLVCLRLLIGLLSVGLALPLLPADPPMVPLPDSSISEPLATKDFGNLAAAAPVLAIASYLLLAWVFSCLLVLGAVSMSLIRLRRLSMEAMPIEDPALIGLADELKDTFKLRSRPGIRQSDSDVGALTVGSQILLSRRTVEQCSEQELRMILAHEFVHLQRRDAWLGLVPQLAQVLFFFNPLVWLACREFDLAREAACDEETLRRLDARPETYGRLLLKIGTRRGFTLYTPGASSHFRTLQRRISMLHKAATNPTRRMKLRTRSVLSAFALVCLMPWTLVQASPVAQAPGEGSRDRPADVTTKPTPGPAPMVAKVLATAPKKTTKKTAAQKKRAVQKLVHVDASLVGKSLAKELKASEATILIDPKNNALIIEGKPTIVDKLVKRLKGLDKKPAVSGPASGAYTVVLRLRHADAADVGKKLAASGVTVSTDARTNSLIVQCKKSEIEAIQGKVAALDVPNTDRPIMKRFVIQHASAEDVVSKIVQSGKAGSIDYITFDPATNCVVARATKTQLSELEKLVKEYDKP